jgi:hypothetical protein
MFAPGVDWQAKDRYSAPYNIVLGQGCFNSFVEIVRNFIIKDLQIFFAGAIDF